MSATPAPGRLLIVSNRLPVTITRDGGAVTLVPASGGLATGLRGWFDHGRGAWIGWPGELDRGDESLRDEGDRLLRERGIIPVHLSREQIDRYYFGFSNRVIWPLFHYLVDKVPVDSPGWEAYREVNAAFADAVAREYRPGDRVWVHDYQLMLAPRLIRERLPDAPIGFFLHIPFPSSEVFRTLPWRAELLNGLLGADLVGFHTYAYMRHFIASLLHVSGIEADIDRVRLEGREVIFSVFPMGVDAQSFERLAGEPDIAASVAEIRRDAGDRQIIVGVDRLDYTKGIPRRLAAIERLLRGEPELADRIRYIQVAVPSRGEVVDYQRFKRHIEERVGRINGAYGTLSSTPIHYIYRSLSVRELVALYCAADVMLVTPLRDGMNLVAKEFIASRSDESGVLVLSEFAGAAAELDGAVVVNPYDVDEVSVQLRKALAMNAPERTARMRSLRERVFRHDVFAWADEFLGQLDAIRPPVTLPVKAPPKASLYSAIEAARARGGLRMLLDYDGTLVGLAKSPELAAPDAELRDLLASLAAAPDIDVQIVSGRPRESLEQWFGDLPVALWAEHGFWYRSSKDTTWRPAAHIDPHWYERVLPILERFTTATPGSRLELKAASLAWHFRGAQRGFGQRQAHELRMLLGDALSNQPLEVLEGHKVVEVRLRGISKAVVAHDPDNTPTDWVTVAIGDDRTDEDLFRALPRASLTIAVGRALWGAQFVVPSYKSVRRVLRALVPEEVPPPPANHTPPRQSPAAGAS